MNDKWTDFEKYVFKELSSMSKSVHKISNKIARLEGRAATWGALGGLLVAVVAEVIVKAISK